MGLDAIVTLAGFILPPAVDFIKKKFLGKDKDTPEATLSALATTKPEVMPEYVKATSGYLDAQTRFFNRDVLGQPSLWVVNLRAAIRPIVVVCAIAIIGSTMFGIVIDPGVKLFCEASAASWLGDRLTTGGGR